jgi:NitT/TauT family transport system ATP-binding protein
MRLVCQHVSKTYTTGSRVVRALDDVSLEVGDGEFVCVLGSSGCGKTTLLKLFAGLLSPTSGAIRAEGLRQNGRPVTALVFQEHGLFPWKTVLDNVAFGLRMRGTSRTESRERAAEGLAKVGLAAVLKSYPHELSAGMRQRANIVRALLVEPHALLMDEPFASLDALTKLALQQDLVRTWETRRHAVVYVTHDIGEAIRLGDRLVIMTGGGGVEGRVHEEIRVPFGRPRDLEAAPTPEIVDLTRHIWRILEHDVRRRLAMTS